jgi:predicted component of type VI protein secretion system
LASREIFVGRSRKCDLVLRDDTVSGVHCRLIAIEGGAIVIDEDSTNGTWLNDVPVVQPTVVTANDELRIGPYSVRVQSLLGGDIAAGLYPRTDRPLPVVPAVSVELKPTAERPLANEPATDLRMPQALVFWRILGFQQPASLEQARAAYDALVKQYPPDKVARLSPEARDSAEVWLREVEFAWDYIQRLCMKSAQQNKGSDA